jgi:hypothetical protein
MEICFEEAVLRGYEELEQDQFEIDNLQRVLDIIEERAQLLAAKVCPSSQQREFNELLLANGLGLFQHTLYLCGSPHYHLGHGYRSYPWRYGEPCLVETEACLTRQRMLLWNAKDNDQSCGLAPGIQTVCHMLTQVHNISATEKMSVLQGIARTLS